MGVSFASYEIPRTGLFVNERGLNVTGHNVSNVNTTGYTRQQAMIMNGPYQNTYTAQGLNQLGLGADIQEIRQIRNSFLDNIYRQESTTLGYWETRKKTFEDIEAVIAEPMQAGLQDSLNNFWDSWQELSKEPDSLTVRALVRQRGESLVQQINHLGSQLDSLQNDLNSELTVKLNEVNAITSQIADLNVKILRNELNSDSANDFRDQRNSLVDQLSKLCNAEVNEMQDGEMDVTLGGYFLVQKGISTDLYAGLANTGDAYYVPKLGGTNIIVPIKNGTIKGLMESRGEVGGAIGSLTNGTPNTMADVIIMVDSSSGYTVDSADVTAYTDELTAKGINFTIQSIPLSPAGATITDTELGTAISSATGLRTDANKYVMLFTDKQAANTAAMTSYLTTAGVELSVATTSAGTNWDTVVSNTDGYTYSVAAGTVSVAQMETMADDVSTDVNEEMSVIPESTNILSDLRKRLNAMVNILVREVNYLHNKGTTLGGTLGDGLDFFTSINSGRPLEMGNIQINSSFSDLNNIAASVSTASGDNTNALTIAKMRGASLIQDIDGLQSLDEYYQSIVLVIGNSGAEATNITSSQQKLVDSADSYRTSVTGVSMDEEMTNMMKYKYAYDASARTLNIIDSMMDQIVNRMGMVGR
ncbi:MAG: flagellar hook-associated protein FlgK [Clostridiales bacterium]|nr:flagellar hook-associated protein FlgK [Clostridiales bacterium]